MRRLYAAALTVAVAGAVTACGSDETTEALVGDAYVAGMSEICTATNARLDALPEPPEQISASNWAAEVARAFRAEAAAAGALVVDATVRSDHGTYTTTTDDLAAAYDDLAVAVGAGTDDIMSVTTEITELSLGRDDVAVRLDLDTCVRSGS